jgi:hypothetical protein
MELDSPASTPPQSPAPVPVTISRSSALTDSIGTHCESKPGLRGETITAFSGLERRDDDQPSPIRQYPSSVAIRSRENTLRAINKPIARPIPTGPATLRSLTPTNASSARAIHNVGSRDLPALSQAPIAGPSQLGSPTTAGVSADTTRRDEAISPVPLVTSKSSVPAKRKPVVANPFVSGGFMTEFVGSSRQKTTPDAVHSAPAVTTASQPSVAKVDIGYISICWFANHFP